MALQEADPVVRFKVEMLRAAMPARSAAVFGDIFKVEGGFTEKCLELGCERVLLVDSLETPAWLRTRLADPRLDFYKGDFSDPLFMASIRESFSISVSFDILLHQPPLLSTLHLILSKTTDAAVIAQPVLKERESPNSLIYLPGLPADSGLYPLAQKSDLFRAFDITQVNQSHWIWAMTPSFIRSVLGGEGFEVVHVAEGGELENPAWMWWGCVARRSGMPEGHWSRTRPTPGLYEPTW
jgi:hypothetical protein